MKKILYIQGDRTPSTPSFLGGILKFWIFCELVQRCVVSWLLEVKWSVVNQVLDGDLCITKFLMENTVLQLQQQVQALVGEMQALRAERHQDGRAARVEDPTPLDVDEEDYVEEDNVMEKESLDWTDVLRGRTVAPTSEPAVQLAQLLSSPPL